MSLYDKDKELTWRAWPQCRQPSLFSPWCFFFAGAVWIKRIDFFCFLWSMDCVFGTMPLDCRLLIESSGWCQKKRILQNFLFFRYPPSFTHLSPHKKTVEIDVIEEANIIYCITIHLLCFYHVGRMLENMTKSYSPCDWIKYIPLYIIFQVYTMKKGTFPKKRYPTPQPPLRVWWDGVKNSDLRRKIRNLDVGTWWFHAFR